MVPLKESRYGVVTRGVLAPVRTERGAADAPPVASRVVGVGRLYRNPRKGPDVERIDLPDGDAWERSSAGGEVRNISGAATTVLAMVVGMETGTSTPAMTCQTYVRGGTVGLDNRSTDGFAITLGRSKVCFPPRL